MSCTTKSTSGEERKKVSRALRAAARSVFYRESRGGIEPAVIPVFKGHRINESEIKGSERPLKSLCSLPRVIRAENHDGGEAGSATQSQSVATARHAAFTTVFTLDCILKIARCHCATMKKGKEFRLKRRLRTLDKNT